MGEHIFVTGARGFVGRHVTELLPQAAVLEGDLLDPPALDGVRVVIHLAAATGKQRSARYFEVNVEGTRLLLAAAQAAGVERFVFVSSVAAVFPDLRRYPYARSKVEAEEAVIRSGVPFVIVRPTVVLGPGSAAEAAFSRGILIGDGRARVQPVDVGDLAETIVRAAGDPELLGRVLEAGGPETLTVAELVRRLTPPGRRVLRVPLAPLRAAVTALEPVAFPLLPFTAGQLTALTTDTVAAATPAVAGADERRRELDIFCRYLAGCAPTAAQLSAYERAHVSIPYGEHGLTALDRRLLSLARRGPRWTRIADAWGRVVAPRSALRQKLVLTLALLEFDGAAEERVMGNAGGRIRSVARVAIAACAFPLFALAGLALIGPRRDGR